MFTSQSENAASVSNEAPAPPAASKPAASAPRSTAGGSSSSGGKDLPPSALARAYEEACQKHGVSKNSALFDQVRLYVCVCRSPTVMGGCVCVCVYPPFLLLSLLDPVWWFFPPSPIFLVFLVCVLFFFHARGGLCILLSS